MGVNLACATSQRRAARAERQRARIEERNTPSARITGLVDLTDQFDANHSFAIYTAPSAALVPSANASRLALVRVAAVSLSSCLFTAQHLEISEWVNYGPMER